ncbi:putative multiple inositol polyphosphate phosphatase 1 [Apostichopus japonicus]|uniref:Multiple inositol polyphosphate phosphatase 1 n=1 Tax=Stichopus japonicus TaxID=307972 RepID=A0A2G8L2R7_STIJA|nr:putative multiple inositol polyphosphate phosphatase 1 [Apostichopus japonicus]
MESALFSESNWCNLFSQSDLRLNEYLEDLVEYWYASHGYSSNYQPSCVLLKNISSYLQTAVEQKSKTKKGMFKFAHSDTVHGLLSLMDLYRPEVAPLANNYPIDVVWDYSAAIITPFASNIGFTLFQCPVTSRLMKVTTKYLLLIANNPSEYRNLSDLFLPVLKDDVIH